MTATPASTTGSTATSTPTTSRAQARSARGDDAMKKLQAPPFLDNLYRDMRDRRLLVPALALLVALIAVPLALSSSSATTAPPPVPPAAASSGAGHEAATSPAVLAEQPGSPTTASASRAQEQGPVPPAFHGSAAAMPGRTRARPERAPSTSAPTGSSTAIPPTTSSGSTTSTSETPSTSPSDTTNLHVVTQPAEAAQADRTTRSGSLSRSARPATDAAKQRQAPVFLPGDDRPMVAFVGADRGHEARRLPDLPRRQRRSRRRQVPPERSTCTSSR